MSNAVFPTIAGLIYPVTKTPIWSTKVQTSASGKETRVGFWSYPRWKYSLGFEVMKSDGAQDFQTLAGFFNSRNGSFDDWLFNDPDDNSVTTQGFGTGDGTTTKFQLLRTLGGYAEPVQATNSTPLIYKNAVLQTVTTHYTISSTGLVTFVTAPAAAAALTWTGTYYWRCRFMDDAIDFQKFMDKFWELRSLDFQSVK